MASACEEPIHTLSEPVVAIEEVAIESATDLGEGRTRYELRARCRSLGPRALAVAALGRSRSPATAVLDGQLRCGAVAAGSSVPSTDTITVVHDGEPPFDPAAFDWVIASIGDKSLERRLDARRFTFVYFIDWTLTGSDSLRARAHVVSARSETQVVQGAFSATLQPGASLTWFGQMLEFVHDRSVPFDPGALIWTIAVDASGAAALGRTRAVDELGHPLGVLVEESGPGGARPQAADAGSGVVALGGEAGVHTWRFWRDGHLPVWRRAELVAGAVADVPSPWLARRSPARVALSPLSGGALGGAGSTVQIAFPGGAFAAPAEGVLTVLDGQTLPGPLPLGWSPLVAFWLELDRAPQAPGRARLAPGAPVPAGSTAALARWDPDAFSWQVLAVAPAAADPVELDVAGAGAYALVLPDAGAGAPPEPAAGAPLAPGGVAPPDPATLHASASVDPAVAPASTVGALVTGAATVVLRGAGPLPSGVTLRSEVLESYRLTDDSLLPAAPYGASFTAYQWPADGDPATLHARLPTRPRLLLGVDELAEARVATEVLAEASFSGSVFGPAGGSAAAPGVVLVALPGDVEGEQPVSLRALDPAPFAALLGAAGEARLAFDLELAGVATGRRLAATFVGQAPDAWFVLARAIAVGGLQGLEPIERFASDARGDLASLEPTSGPRLPGVTGAGSYVLVRVAGPQALVEGVVRDAGGTPVAGLAVRIEGLPWLTASRAGGAYQLVAGPGPATIAALDPVGGDEGLAAVLIGDPAGGPTVVDLATRPTGPRVVATTPAAGAVAVDAVTPIEVVFSEPVAPGPLAAAAIVLRDAAGVAVAATLGLDRRGRVATLLPGEPLAYGASYTIELSDAITDLTGLPLEGARAFAFTVEGAPTRLAGAQLVSWAPGSEAQDCAGIPGLAGAPPETCNCATVPGFPAGDPAISCVLGTAGTADPEVPVILVNQSTGATATVLSGPDGSFKSFVAAGEDDFLAAVFVNANGTRVEVPLARQLFDDGAVALFRSGGILEAESDGGPVQVFVEPGAIPNKTRFRLDTVSASELIDAIGTVPPDGGRVLGGVRFAMDGDAPAEPPDISFPVRVEDLGLAPGVDPAQAVYALAIPQPSPEGAAYQIIDKMEFEAGETPGAGRVATASFPFIGITAFVAPILLTPIVLATSQGGLSVYGRVLTADQGPGGALANTQPLPGAIVVGTGDGQVGANGRNGVRPGGTYAIADPDGRYAMRIPRSRLEEGVVVEALHPRIAGLRSQAGFALGDTTVEAIGVYRRDLYFLSSALAGGGDQAPPFAYASHTPLFPPPGGSATLRITATDDASRPSIEVVEVRVQSLVPGVDVAPGDVTVTPGAAEAPNATTRRQSFEVRSTSASRVTLAIEVTDAAGREFKFERRIDFGGAPTPVGSEIPADPDDDRGPQVVWSSPSAGSTGHAPGDEIRLRFDTAIAPEALADPSWLSIQGFEGRPVLERSPDGTELVITAYGLRPDQDVVVSIDSGLVDTAGNPFDQDPTTDERDSFHLEFRTAPAPTAALPGIEAGAGVVQQGIYAFAIDQLGPEGGALVAFDLSDPREPVRIGSLSVPGYPRDLVAIGPYSFQRGAAGGAVSQTPTAPETRNLVAVAGGLMRGVDGDGFGASFQYLWIIDVSDPARPRRVASELVAFGITAVTRLGWSAPYLFFLESQADVTAVHRVLLQSFVYGTNLSSAEFAQLPSQGSPGLDANQDGDFVDPGDRLPLPARTGPLYPGFEFAYTLPDTNQRILDFTVNRAGSFLGVVAGGGCPLGTAACGPVTGEGEPNPSWIGPQYRTLAAGTDFLDPAAASFALPGEGKRVLSLGRVEIEIAGEPRVEDLVLVTLFGASGTPGRVVVLSVTDPLAPFEVGTIEVPAVHGLVQSALLRDEGLVALATTRDVLLLDPARLGEAPLRLGDPHPALVGVVPGAGGNAPVFASGDGGLHLASHGGRTVVVQSAPSLAFVSLLEVAPFDPEAWLEEATPEEVAERLAGARRETSLQPARFRGVAGIGSSLLPPAPEAHYYVLVRAPGSAGASIELALESLGPAGRPLRTRGLLFPPVRAAAEPTVAKLGEPPGEGEPANASLRAFRLSSDRTSPLYNLYLSRPLALVYEEMSVADLESVTGVLPRAVLWSGHGLRASLDPDGALAAGLGAFASVVDEDLREIRPGVAALARTLAADYLMGPNPAPLRGGVALPEALGSVMAHSGELRAEADDFFLRGRRLHLQLRRVNTGQALYDGPFGRGWDWNWNQRILPLRPEVFLEGQRMPLVIRGSLEDSEIAGSGDVIWYNGSGRAFVFQEVDGAPPDEIAGDPLVQQLGWLARAERFYRPPAGLFSVLARFPDGSHALLDPDGQQTWFRPDGRIDRVYDRWTENRIEVAYESNGQLRRITGDNGSWIEVGWWRSSDDASCAAPPNACTPQARVQGRVAKLVDHTDRELRFFYSDDGVLLRREGPEITTAGPGGFSGWPVEHYATSDAEDPARTARSISGFGNDADGEPLVQATGLASGARDVVATLAAPGGPVQLGLGQASSAESLAGGGSATVGGGGAQTQYQFDPFGRVLSASISAGGAPPVSSTFEYDPSGSGLVTRVVFPRGNEVLYRYDNESPVLRARGNLVEVRRLPAPGGGGGEPLVATAEYDPRYNLPSAKVDFGGRTYQIDLRGDGRDTASISIGGDASGDFEAFQYNGFGQLVSHRMLGGVTRTWSLDPTTGFVTQETTGPVGTSYQYEGAAGRRGLATTTLDGRGIATELVYDERNQLVRRSRGGMLVSEHSYDDRGGEIRTATVVGGGESLVETRVFDALGFLLEERRQSVETDGGAADLVTTFEPDAQRRVRRIVHPSGEVHELDYDGLGRVRALRVGSGGEYGELFTYDANGNLETRTVGDAEWRYVHDGHDRLVRMTDPLGATRIYEYTPDGRIEGLRIEDPEGQVPFEASYRLDVHGRYEEVRVRGDGGDSVVRYAYQPGARTVTMTDALGAQAVFAYDAAGRLFRVARPDLVVEHVLDGNGNVSEATTLSGGTPRTETYGYDDFDRVTSWSDGAGGSLSFPRDAGGRLAARSDRRGESGSLAYTRLGEFAETVTPEGVVTRFRYDANRQLAAIGRGDGRETRHETDGLGRVVRTVHPDGSETRTTSFDARSCPLAMELPGGVALAQTVNAVCAPLTRAISGPAGNLQETFRYDGLGRLVHHALDGAALDYEFSRLGHTRRVTRTQNGLVHELQQEADAGGFRQRLVLPSGVAVTAVRDGTGRLQELAADVGGPVLSGTTWRADDLVATRTLGAGAVALEASYDEQDRPVAIRWTRPADGSVLAELRYALDPEGLVVARQALHEGGLADFYEHDGDRRLRRADTDARPAVPGAAPRSLIGFGPGVGGDWAPGAWAREYRYAATDGLDGALDVNPDGLVLPPFANAYGPANVLLAPGSIDGVATLPDAVANLTRLPVHARSTTGAPLVGSTASLSYDALGRLTRAGRADGCVVQYRYDPAGLLARRTVEGATPDCVGADLDYTWDGGNLVEIRRLPEGVVVARFHYGDESDELLAGDLDDGTGSLRRVYYLTDALRSVVAVADQAGQVIERVRYDAWGQPTLEARDAAAPRVARVRVDGDALVVEFTEPVLPPLLETGPTGLVSATAALDDLFSLPGVTPSSGSAVYSEAEPGAGFRTAIRFVPDGGLPPRPFTLAVAAGRLRDRWGNPNGAEQVLVAIGEPAYSGPSPGSSAPVVLGRSSVGSPFLFHGQLFDPETGLYYLRARFYDPGSGHFLQADPAGYAESVSPHVAFANDPVSRRDPTGTRSICNAFSGGRDCGELGRELKQTAGEFQYRKDGIFGLGGALILEFAGGVLDVGTGVAQGLELAGEPRRGPAGAVDLVRGWSLVLGDVATVTGVLSGGVGSIHLVNGAGAAIRANGFVARARAYSVSAYQHTRDVALQRLGWKTPWEILTDHYGYDIAEARAFVSGVMRENVIISTRQGLNLGKLRQRQRWVALGARQKPFGVYEKTGADALVRTKRGVFTGDIDVFEIRHEKSGVPLATSERKRVSLAINDDYQVHTGRRSVPIQHHSQLQALDPDAFESVARGFTADANGYETVLKIDTLKKIGHPGHTVTIRRDRRGNLVAYRTPGWQVDGEIRQAQRAFAGRLRERWGGDVGEYAGELASGTWSHWKWE